VKVLKKGMHRLSRFLNNPKNIWVVVSLLLLAIFVFFSYFAGLIYGVLVACMCAMLFNTVIGLMGNVYRVMGINVKMLSIGLGLFTVVFVVFAYLELMPAELNDMYLGVLGINFVATLLGIIMHFKPLKVIHPPKQ